MASVPAWAAARVTGARTVNWVQDIFPEVAWALDFRRLPRGLERALAWPRDRSLRAARMNVALGALMAEYVASRGVEPSRVRVIPNWAPGDEIRPRPAEGHPLREAWGLQGRFVVGYSGNMGRAHDFDALLAAAATLREDDRVRFLLIGDGNRRAALERDIAARALANVILKPYQPRERLAESLTVPDCHIVSLRPSLEGLIVPSKLYSSLAAGRPVIFIGSLDGEVARVMRDEAAFGPVATCVAPDDVEGLVRAIQTLAGDPGEAARRGANGRRLFEARFDRRYAMDAWARLLEEAGA
jgi:colanic acid biosynthesis glycosyl transferase WcaI